VEGGLTEISVRLGTDRGKARDFLVGKLLVAMPSMDDPRFSRTVIYMCSHTSERAMGLIINRPATHITFPELLSQLNIEPMRTNIHVPIQVGGPVETGRGFVLHSSDYHMADSTLNVGADIGLTATLDVLRAIAAGKGPSKAILALGYAGWGPGQLESEILANGWLHVEADHALLFDQDLDTKWARAISKLGFQPHHLSGQAGHA
jgi:putative transcriptional regulator